MIPSILSMATALGASVTVSPGDDLSAVTSSLNPGDVVTFSEGVYELEESIYWEGIGTEEEPILLRAADGVEAVLHSISGGGYIATISNSDWIVMENLVFEGVVEETTAGYGYYSGPSGLRIADSSNVTVRDCTIRDVWGTGVRLDGNTNNLTIEHNEIASSGDGSGIYAGCGDGSCWIQDSTITNNLIHDVAYDGINLQRGSQGVAISHNVIFRTGDDGLELPDTQGGPQNHALSNAIWQTEGVGIYVWGQALVQNNLVFEIGDHGIYTRDDYDSLHDVQISHNTVARTDGYAARLDDWYDKDGMVFANNALANPTGYGLRYDDPMSEEDGYGYGYGYGYEVGDTENYIRNNVVTGLVEGFDMLIRPDFVIEGGGAGDFVDMDNFDFYPTSSSLLRDQGDPDGNAYIPPTDFNGAPRDGATPDVGAYAYSGSENPGWVVAEGFKDVDALSLLGQGGVSTGCCGSDKSSGSQALLLGPLLALGLLARRRS
ncbi:MAG TPA: right-handed parallel beta-helix repeat-containing protein [Deltaproteobacteria bacterium]|nr:right-handed parallel beta-helix repeat-containing protein [Deltaproteobacteria bacterium]